MSNDLPALVAAASRVAHAIKWHATVCVANPRDVAAIVAVGEELVESVLHYERVLRDSTGWSNPLRHLGSLPMFDAEPPLSTPEAGGRDEERTNPVRLVLDASYRLIVDERRTVAFAEGRTGEEMGNVEEAVVSLFKADSWNPEGYPPGFLAVESVTVEVAPGNASR